MMLAETITEKIIPRNYARIQHLQGSKMIDNRDKLIDEREELYLTRQLQKPNDIVIITEKIDGANVGVLRQNDKLYPILRKGYDVRTNRHLWIRSFAYYVNKNSNRFMELLSNGERCCGEWLIKTHTLDYKVPHEPFIIFDIISNNKRNSYFDIKRKSQNLKFPVVGLVHAGQPMEPQKAIELLGNGFCGVDGKPEGIVYRYERNFEFIFSAKYVSNPLLGTSLFKENEYIYNKNKSGGYFTDTTYGDD